MHLNTATTIHPRLHHLAITTDNIDAMITWYQQVLGMSVLHRTGSALPGQSGAPAIASAWLTNDEANHRIALVNIPGLEADPQKTRHRRIQHFAFEYSTIAELLGTYLRLKSLGITPVLCTDAGLQTAFYYLDPDGNTVEINVDNFGNPLTSTEYLKNSPEFAANPMGAYVDPEKMIEAYSAGITPWDLHVMARAGEFAPSIPYDPRVMM